MIESIKLLIEDLNKDFQTALDQVLEVDEYNYTYNKYNGYDVDVTFTYDEGTVVDLVVYLDNGLLPTPVALEIEVRNACIEFCSHLKELEDSEGDREETEKHLMYNYE